MKYNYPDPNDSITYAKISQYQTKLQDYWKLSEDKILERVLERLKPSVSPNSSMLDVGCGEGRLLRVFNQLFKDITAFDPDQQRLDNVDLSSLEGEIKISVDTLDTFASNAQFDFIVCSHIIQHIHTGEVEPFVARLSALVNDEGYVYLTTNHSTESQDYYVKSFIEKGGENVELRVERGEFNDLVSEVGVLPIHFFDDASLRDVFRKYGLEVVEMRVFHENAEAPEGQFIDDYINSTPELQARSGRDVYYLLQKSSEKEDSAYPLDFLSKRTSVCTLTYIPLPGVGQEKVISEVKAKLCDKKVIPCPNCADAKSGIASGDDDVCNCFYHCSNFLKDRNDTLRDFYNERIYLKTFEAAEDEIFGKLRINYILEYFPNQNALILLMNVYCNRQLNVDKTIKLRHFLARGGDEYNDIINAKDEILRQVKDGTLTAQQKQKIRRTQRQVLAEIQQEGFSSSPNSLNNLFRKAILDIIDAADPAQDVTHNKFDGNLIIEIDKASLVEQSPQQICRQLYGIMTGDEGWRFVPESVALQKVFRYGWGSREFVKSYFFGATTLILNSKPDHYISSQKTSGEYIYGGSNPYFGIKPCIAGLDHLILEAVEKGFLTLHSIDTQLERVQNYYKYHKEHPKNGIVESIKRLMGLASSDDISDLNDLSRIRVVIISVLNSTYSTSQELDDLTRIIFEQNGINSRFEDLKYELSLLGEDIKFSHDKIESDILTVLTVLTVVISIVIGTFSIIEHNTNNLFFVKRFVHFLDSDFGYYLYFVFVVLMLFIISGISIKRTRGKKTRKKVHKI